MAAAKLWGGFGERLRADGTPKPPSVATFPPQNAKRDGVLFRDEGISLDVRLKPPPPGASRGGGSPPIVPCSRGALGRAPCPLPPARGAGLGSPRPGPSNLLRAAGAAPSPPAPSGLPFGPPGGAVALRTAARGVARRGGRGAPIGGRAAGAWRAAAGAGGGVAALHTRGGDVTRAGGPVPRLRSARPGPARLPPAAHALPPAAADACGAARGARGGRGCAAGAAGPGRRWLRIWWCCSAWPPPRPPWKVRRGTSGRGREAASGWSGGGGGGRAAGRSPRSRGSRGGAPRRARCVAVRGGGAARAVLRGCRGAVPFPAPPVEHRGCAPRLPRPQLFVSRAANVGPSRSVARRPGRVAPCPVSSATPGRCSRLVPLRVGAAQPAALRVPPGPGATALGARRGSAGRAARISTTGSAEGSALRESPRVRLLLHPPVASLAERAGGWRSFACPSGWQRVW